MTPASLRRKKTDEQDGEEAAQMELLLATSLSSYPAGFVDTGWSLRGNLRGYSRNDRLLHASGDV
jgi:hypothetical protein